MLFLRILSKKDYNKLKFSNFRHFSLIFKLKRFPNSKKNQITLFRDLSTFFDLYTIISKLYNIITLSFNGLNLKPKSTLRLAS